jgi:flagellar assembly factor FliW
MAMILEKQVFDHALDVRLEPGHGTKRALSPDQEIMETQRVETTRFGVLEVETDLILTLPDGIIGFDSCTRYIVISTEGNGAFRWLQSLDRPELAFPILDPTTFRPDYAPVISDTDARLLGLTSDAPFLLFSVVTVPSHAPREMTANLLAPVVINGLTRYGRQVIVQDEGYSTRHKVVDELQRAAARAASTVAVATVAPKKPEDAARAA